MVMPDSTPLDPYESTDAVVCPSCVTVNGEHQHFCRECGTPLTSLSVIDPVGHIYATGDTYRKAMNHPTSLIVVIGTWLIFGPGVLFAAIPLSEAIGGMSRPSRYATPVLDVLVGFVTGIGMSAISLIILYRVTRNYVHVRRQLTEQRGFEVVLSDDDANDPGSDE